MSESTQGSAENVEGDQVVVNEAESTEATGTEAPAETPDSDGDGDSTEGGDSTEE